MPAVWPGGSIVPQNEMLAMAGVIYEKQDNYWLYHKLTVEDDEEEKLQPADKAWTIVKYSQNKAGSAGGLKLRIGDTVKFGRVRFKVIMLRNRVDGE